MKHTVATPKSIEEAIYKAINESQIFGPEMVDEMVLSVRDYLAQKFGAAMMQASDEESVRLKALFERIVKKDLA